MSTKTFYQRFLLSDKGSFSESPIIRNRTYSVAQDNFTAESQTMSDGSPSSNITQIQGSIRHPRRSRFSSQPTLMKLESTMDNNRSTSKSNSPDSREIDNEPQINRKKSKFVSSLEDIDSSNYPQNQSTLMHLDSTHDAQGQNGFQRNLTVKLTANTTFSVSSIKSNIFEAGPGEAISPLKRQMGIDPKYFWRYPQTKIGGVQGTVPDGGEGSSLVGLGRDLYLFGGAKKDSMIGDLWKYKPSKNSWKKIACENKSQIKGRAGHSAIALKGCMYMFGGEVQYQADSQVYTKVVNDLLIYHPNVMRWTMHMNNKGTENCVQGRKYHAVSVYEQVMIVHGGIGTVGNYLNDIWAFNAEYEHWKKLPVKRNEFERGGGIAHHTMCSVFGEKGNLGHDDRKHSKIQLEGFYVFGGKNEKGESLNTLQVLTYNHEKRGLSWVHPHVKGLPPSARYQHTMVHFPETNCLIIYGGRSNVLSKNPGKFNYDDLIILNLEFMIWITPKVSGDTSIKGRYSHSCTINSGKMFVFGGKSCENYLDTALSILELKANDVEKLQSMANVSKQPSLKDINQSFVISRDITTALFEGQIGTPSHIQRKLPQNNKSPKARPRVEHLPSIFNSTATGSRWNLLSKNSASLSNTETTSVSKPHQTVFHFFKNNFSPSTSTITSDILD